MTFLKVLLTLYAVFGTIALFIGAEYIDSFVIGMGMGVLVTLSWAFVVQMWMED